MSDLEILEEQKARYGQQYDAYGDDVRSTFQNDEATQFLRFEKLLEPFLRFNGDREFSIHDFGAGLADLHRYLRTQGLSHSYSGTEIVEAMASKCCEKFPGINVTSEPFENGAGKREYDLVVASGTFNLRSGQEERRWKSYVYDTMKNMFDAATKCISVNFLTSYSTFRDPELFYADPQDMMNFCVSELSRFVVIDHGVPLYEFTMTVFREDFVAQRYPGDDYSKYFQRRS